MQSDRTDFSQVYFFSKKYICIEISSFQCKKYRRHSVYFDINKRTETVTVRNGQRITVVTRQTSLTVKPGCVIDALETFTRLPARRTRVTLMYNGCRVEGKPGVYHLVTSNIPLDSEFSRDCGEWMVWEGPNRQSARRTWGNPRPITVTVFNEQALRGDANTARWL